MYIHSSNRLHNSYRFLYKYASEILSKPLILVNLVAYFHHLLPFSTMHNAFLSARRNVIAAVAVTTTLFLTSCEPEIQLDDAATTQSGLSGARTAGGDFVDGELLVKFAKGADNNTREQALLKLKGEVSEKVLTATMQRYGDDEGITIVRTSLPVLEAVAQMKNTPGVEYAEPNYIYSHQATSNDPLFTNGSLWGMYGASTTPANQFGSHAAVAWANGKTGSSSVIVGVIDEGFMVNHEDLNANAWVNSREIAGNRVDDDRNGYVDDINGWDFAGNNASVFDGTSDDHGTHVAGTIGGVGGNGRGVAGVNWSVKMISLKFLGTFGGSTANAIRAIDYLTAIKNRGENVIASNNSWGGGGFSQALQDAIERANQAGVLFIAAAGNGGGDGVGDNNDNVANYPSNYPNANVIAVGSITSAGVRSGFSNFGATQVDLFAPGSGIQSTLPGRRNTSTYGAYSGTSMATPHVTGAAALYKSINTGASAADVKQAVLNAATPTPSLSGLCVTGGRLNVSSF